ncbi:TPA: minor capsid protein [Streptococcus suis]|uniref:minor capsid protein n=1 Tax=Streptococcus suis TaxID=1307 RepID=UPI000462DF0E|nr:minor capsid protein [Streptococcus suis]MCB2905690.1 minor capsid protein [Streptococcus suis]MDS1160891.1 minor capsid protein [Streptococcus suis]NQO47627.1 capsid protein [Streptococcus suis]HEL1573263.1 minor capsid protein [Streptococcus suis]HEL1905490.1 minor capsid protein [Streptococcus suis]
MQNNKNFQQVLLDHINNIEHIPLKARLDYFEDDKDDLVINALSGGVIDKEYMDGTREVSLPFEVAIKCKENKKATDTIWLINGDLSSLDIDLPSTDNSYTFLSLSVDKPGINGKDEQGYFVYSMQVIAKLEIQGG